MGFTLDQIVPWGRSFDEYLQMFALTADELNDTHLDCAGGPAGFNAVMARRGRSVISCDPIYQFSASQIRDRIRETYPVILEQLRNNSGDYVWTKMRSPEHLGDIRMGAMDEFLADFPRGVAAGRYIGAELPHLPFNSNQFDRALCSHFLFSYSDRLSEDFHRQSILELCRVAREVRLFPLITISGETPPFLESLIAELARSGYTADIRTVPYQFQIGGNRMLNIRPAE